MNFLFYTHDTHMYAITLFIILHVFIRLIEPELLDHKKTREYCAMAIKVIANGIIANLHCSLEGKCYDSTMLAC